MTVFREFLCRQQLMDVKMIGAKTFEQCAGFLRILPSSNAAESEGEPPKKARKKASGKRSPTNEPNPLDRSCVHPESYHIAEKCVGY
jgi:transcriptional accessory protein Tex/SPT6